MGLQTTYLLTQGDSITKNLEAKPHQLDSVILPCEACYGLISSPIRSEIFPQILTIKINSFPLKKIKCFLQSKWLKHKHWHWGRGQVNSFLITKAILQGLRVRIMLKKCWHKLTLEARARHFCSILFFFFQLLSSGFMELHNSWPWKPNSYGWLQWVLPFFFRAKNGTMCDWE